MAKRKKKISRASKHRLVVLVPFCIFAFVYLSFCLCSSAIKLYNLKQQSIDLDNQLTQLKENEEELKIEIDRLNDPDYLARYARENYLYSKDGEYVIKIEDEKEIDPKEIKQLHVNADFVIIISGILLLIIMLCILKRRKRKNRKNKKTQTKK